MTLCPVHTKGRKERRLLSAFRHELLIAVISWSQQRFSVSRRGVYISHWDREVRHSFVESSGMSSVTVCSLRKAHLGAKPEQSVDVSTPEIFKDSETLIESSSSSIVVISFFVMTSTHWTHMSHDDVLLGDRSARPSSLYQYSHSR